MIKHFNLFLRVVGKFGVSNILVFNNHVVKRYACEICRQVDTIIQDTDKKREDQSAKQVGLDH